MAGDRHGKHNTTTISFRVNSYEKATILIVCVIAFVLFIDAIAFGIIGPVPN